MRRSFIIIVVYLLLLSGPANATNDSGPRKSLSGKVTDKKTGEGLPGVIIYVPDIKTGTATDSSGKYLIENLPASKILIQVSMVGYKTIVVPVDLSILLEMDFAMEESIKEMNEVVVTGTSRASEMRRDPTPITGMDRINIDQNLSTNIIDAIAKTLPGISAVTTGPNISKPFIRGLGFNRVLTLYDGVRQEGQQWGDEHGIEVDGYGVAKIEVVKGPASLSYGSDALAGVVNLIPFPPVPPGTISGSLVAEYQTNARLIGSSLVINGNNHGIIWGTRISHKQATNYQDRIDGRVYGTAFEETDGSVNAGINRHWGYAHLNFSVYDDLQEIPDGSRDSLTRKFTKQITEADTVRQIVSNAELNSYRIATIHQHIQHYRFYSVNNFFFGKSSLGLTLGYQQNIRSEYNHPLAPPTPGLSLVLHSFTYDLKYSLPEWKGWEAIFGINGMYQLNANKGTEFIIPDYHEFDAGPFVMLKKAFDRVDVSAGMRYDVRFFSSDDMYTRKDPRSGFEMQVKLPDTSGAAHPFAKFSHQFSGISASIGASWNLTDKLLIKANIARGFRTPNISEISANGVHPGTNIYQLGNENFKPEFSLQEDLGIFYTSKVISGFIQAFFSDISNYIFNQKVLTSTGKDSVIVKGNQTFQFEQSHAQLYGGEAMLDIHPLKRDWLHFENSVSVVYAINKGTGTVHVQDSSRYLPFIPPLHFHSEIRAEIKKKFTHLSGIYAKISLEYFARQNRVYLAFNTETPTSGYLLLDGGIGASITKKSGKILFTLMIAGDNLADAAYQSHLSRLKYFEEYPGNASGKNGIYDMGRNIAVKVIVPVDFR